MGYVHSSICEFCLQSSALVQRAAYLIAASHLAKVKNQSFSRLNCLLEFMAQLLHCLRRRESLLNSINIRPLRKNRAMLKSSIWLSIMTAFLGADSSNISSRTERSTQSPVAQALQFSEEELTESQRINEEARRNVGRELLDL